VDAVFIRVARGYHKRKALEHAMKLEELILKKEG